VIGPGDVRLSASLHVGAKQELVVKAGTRISMGPNVSILSRGRIVVEGTATNPVHIGPADPQAPWGTLGVVGAASEGSRFSHMHLRGGGDGTDGRVHFKGMLNIYGSDGVVIQDCAFGPNARGDDAVNIASSTFVVKDSSWNDALADALDIDMSDGVIERSRFMNSGNDGLDVMGGTVIIRESRMHGNGDKGISIGERASVLGEGLHIARNRVGVEVKDDSWVALSRSRLERNDIGWHAYRKKKFYQGGGRALLIDSDISVLNKETDVFLEPFSNLLLVRTDLRLDTPVDGLDMAEAVPQPWKKWLAKFVDRPDQSRESTASSGPSNGELSPSSLAQRASTR